MSKNSVHQRCVGRESFEHSKREYERVSAWQEEMIEALRDRRARLQRTMAASRRFLQRYSEEACLRRGGWLQFRLECAWEVQCTYDRRISEIDRMIERIDGAAVEVLAPFFRNRNGLREAIAA